MLDECYDAPERSRHPVFVALRETIVACELPRQLFHDLLAAFKLDQTKTRYAIDGRSWRSTRTTRRTRWGGWCFGSAGIARRSVALLSDKVCTALQLANFWQDVVEDCGARAAVSAGGVAGAVWRDR